MNKKKGFTLVELIIVLVIISIISAILVPRVISFIESGKIGADKANLRTLNTVSHFYYTQYGEPIKNETVNLESAALSLQEEKLVNNEFLNDVITAKVKGQYFYWFYDENSSNGRWMYSIYALAGNLSEFYDFTKININDLDAKYGENGQSWSIDSDGLLATGNNNDLMYLGNPKENYTITVSFKLGDSSGKSYGGVGILFETVITGNNDIDNEDTGYIIQFDRGMKGSSTYPGEINLRYRNDGVEGNRFVRIDKWDNGDNFPSQDDAWWQEDRELSISVNNSSEQGKKLLTVFLDGKVVLQDYEIDSDIEALNNYTGFRTWNGVSAEFKKLDIR